MKSFGTLFQFFKHKNLYESKDANIWKLKILNIIGIM